MNEEKKKGFIEKKNKILDEFKKFIMRGNVLDLAVGVIVGGAFSKIVSSLVDNILMPIIGVIIGGIDFSELSFNIGDATINYGLFFQNVIDFLIIAVCIFAFVKLINKLFNKDKKEEVKPAPEAPKKSDEVLLLEEIRDLLKPKKGVKKVSKKTDK